MYLVKTKNENKILSCADEVKNINKKDIIKVYALTEIDYDNLVSTSDVRDCVYNCLKEKTMRKEEVLEYVSCRLNIKKSEVSKVITSMKKEKIIYIEKEFGWIGIR